MTYNNVEHWTKAGKTYFNRFNFNNPVYKQQEQFLVDYIRDNKILDTNNNNNDKKNKKKNRILEFGSGFGRITRLLFENFDKNIKEYVSVDLSLDQLNNAIEYIPVKYFDKIHFDMKDITNFNDPRKFDLVLAVETLMHIPPKKLIHKAIRKMVSLSNRHIINIDWYEDPIVTKVIDPINFIHDYEELYKDAESIQRIINNQRIQTLNINKIKLPNITNQYLFHVILNE